jgi:hypothetical protein
MRRTVLISLLAVALAGGAFVVGLLVSDGGGSPAAAAPQGGTATARATRPTARPPRALLFAHDADAGSLVRAAEGEGLYDLKLTGVHPSALYFADRPARIVGATPLARMLSGFFGKPEKGDLPNAAINTVDPTSGKQMVMGAELLSAQYSAKAGTLTYRIRALPQGPADAREHGRTDVVLPATLGQTSLFIDDSYRSCAALVSNETMETATYSSQSLYTHDDWTTAPSNARVGNDSVNAAGVVFPSTYLEWGSESGFDRGCWNNATFAFASYGSFTIAVADPWSGSNSASCTFKGVPGVECLRQAAPYGNPVWGGDQLSAQFSVCLDRASFPQNDHVDCDTHVAQGDLVR